VAATIFLPSCLSFPQALLAHLIQMSADLEHELDRSRHHTAMLSQGDIQSSCEHLVGIHCQAPGITGREGGGSSSCLWRSWIAPDPQLHPQPCHCFCHLLSSST
jgi:hypothetical protein